MDQSPPPFIHPPLKKEKMCLEGSHHPYVQALEAICLYEYATAKGLLVTISVEDPLFAKGQIQLGYLCLWEGNCIEAKEAFDRVLPFKLFEAQALQGLYHLALVLEKHTHSQEEALSIYQQLLQKDPGQLDYRFGMGKLLSWMHQWGQAEEVLLSCLKEDPHHSDAGVQLGYLYLWQQRLEEAKKLFEQFPQNQEAMRGLGKLRQLASIQPIDHLPSPYKEQGLQRITSVQSPQGADYFYLQALQLLGRGQNKEAKELLLQALQLDPHFFDAILQLGYLYLWEGNTLQAEEEFRKALKEHPCDPKALQSLWKVAQEIETKPPEQERALAIYTLLVQCNPKQTDFLYYQGKLLSWMHRWEEAEQVLLTCLSLDPDQSDAGVQMGYLLLWQGRFVESKKYFARFSHRSDAQQGMQKLQEILASSPLPPPFQTPPSLEQEPLIRLLVEATEERQVNHRYLQALLFLCQGNQVQALECLDSLDLLQAHLQRGYLFLWQKRWQEAERAFALALKKSPCDPLATEGQVLAALQLEKESFYEEALSIYQTAIQCNPDNADLLYYQGRLLSWMHRWKEAEQVLLTCLQKTPNHSDAGIQLGTLYLWEGKLFEAKQWFERFSSRTEAKTGLAKIAAREGHCQEASYWYAQAIQEGDHDVTTGLGMARSLASCLDYQAAKKEYEQWLSRDPSNLSLQQELFDTKLRTDPSYTSKSLFVWSKENDPTLQKPVVIDDYFETNLGSTIPIFNRWTVEVKGFFGLQKERDILPPDGMNYNVRLTGPTFLSHYFFAKDWRLDLRTSLKSAWGVGDNTFPFITTTRFEPGATALYLSESQAFTLSAHVDSFLIKDFSINRSRLLQVDTLEATYGYTFPVRIQPQVEVGLRRGWYKDSIHNIKTSEEAWIRCKGPYVEEYLDLFFHAVHSHFDKLTSNYFSFQEQVINTLGACLHTELSRKMYTKVQYEHAWWWTKELIQPIGNLLYVAPLQVLSANRAELIFGARVQESLKVEAKGFYYRNSLPYRAAGAFLELTWFF